MYDYEKIAAVVAELTATKKRVDELESQFHALIKPTTAVPGNLTDEIEKAYGFVSTSTRVIELLNSEPSRSFSFQDIFGKVGGNEPYIRSLLSRLVREGKIEKRDWHNYGAVQNKEAQSR
jgi:hypothetical protein